MTTTATVAQLAGASLTAERAAFAPPTWVVIATASNDALIATVPLIAQKQHWVTHMTVSFSAAPAAATTLTIKDGSTVIWQVEISTDIRVFTENFETRPLHSSTGAALNFTLGAGGSGIVGTLSATGFTAMLP